MNDYLANLAARSLDLAQQIQPRPLALFEPGPVTGGTAVPLDRPAVGVGKRAAGDALAEEPPWGGLAWGEPLAPRTLKALSAAPVAALAPSVDVAAPGPPAPVSLEAEPAAVTHYPSATVPPLARQQAHTRLDGAAAVEPESPGIAPPLSKTPGSAATVRPASAVAEEDARPSPCAIPTAEPEVAGAILQLPVEAAGGHRGAPPSLAPCGSEQKPNPGNAPCQIQVVSGPALGTPPEVPAVDESPSSSPDGAGREPPAGGIQSVVPAWQPRPVNDEQLMARPTVTRPQPPEPVVQVTIGRIEVHVAAPPKPRREAPARLPTLGLTEYLQQCGGKR